MEYRHYITVEPGKRGGKPCVRGLRITVDEVLEYLSYMSDAEVLDDFSYLTADDLAACRAFDADRRRLTFHPPGPDETAVRRDAVGSAAPAAS